MVFTQCDLKKIKDYLISSDSIKDSQFNAVNSLDTSDEVVILHLGENKRVNIKILEEYTINNIPVITNRDIDIITQK